MNKLKFSPNALLITEPFALLITYDTAILERKAATSRVKKKQTLLPVRYKKDYLKISKRWSKIFKH